MRSGERALGLSVSAPLTSCGVAACWHAELSTLNLLLLWLNTYLSNSFNSSIHVFHSKIDENSLGLALHESWGVACATTEKQWCPVSTESTSTCFRGKAFLQANLHKAGCRKRLMSKEYTYACFGGQAFQGQTRNLNQSHLRRGKQGWGREKALNLFVSAPLTNCNVATCWHVELSTAQLPSLNLVNRMCLSNSDFDVQSVGYKSAQSPTNWESIHGKDPSILCWLSSRLSMALSNENPKGEIQDCALTKETCNNHVHAMYVKFGELAINTLQVQLRRDGGSCLSKIKI